MRLLKRRAALGGRAAARPMVSPSQRPICAPSISRSPWIGVVVTAWASGSTAGAVACGSGGLLGGGSGDGAAISSGGAAGDCCHDVASDAGMSPCAMGGVCGRYATGAGRGRDRAAFASGTRNGGGVVGAGAWRAARGGVGMARLVAGACFGTSAPTSGGSRGAKTRRGATGPGPASGFGTGVDREMAGCAGRTAGFCTGGETPAAGRGWAGGGAEASRTSILGRGGAVTGTCGGTAGAIGGEGRGDVARLGAVAGVAGVAGVLGVLGAGDA